MSVVSELFDGIWGNLLKTPLLFCIVFVASVKRGGIKYTRDENGDIIKERDCSFSST